MDRKIRVFPLQSLFRLHLRPAQLGSSFVTSVLVSALTLSACKRNVSPVVEAPTPVPAESPLGPLATATVPPASAPNRTPYREVRGVWITNVDSKVLESTEAIDRAFERLARLGFTTVYPVVWNKGYTLYPSPVAERAFGKSVFPGTKFADAGRDMMRDAMASARKYGLEVIPWFESGLKIPADHPLVAKQPGWFTQTKEGSKIRDDVIKWVYLNPAVPEVRKFMRELIADVQIRYAPDGVHLDDHFSLWHEFGYDSANVALFGAMSAPATGASALPASQDSNWLKARADVLTELVVQIASDVRARRPGAVMSISSNVYPWSFQNYLQDWPSWIRRGAADEFILQNYHEDFAKFKRDALSLNTMLGQLPRRPYAAMGILSGLRGRRVTTAELQQRIVASRESGFGLAFFFYESLFELHATSETPTIRENFFAQSFLQPSFPRRSPAPPGSGNPVVP